MVKAIDLTGRRFGQWTVLKRAENLSNGNAQWLCRCECGVEKLVRGTRLRSSSTSHSCYDCAVKTGHKEITGAYWNRVQYSAGKRELDFAISIEEAWQLFLAQDRRCAISDLDIEFQPRTASLDRIDSSLGYILDNVQWVHKDINKIKQDLSEERFIELCRLVAYSPKTIWR